MPSRSDGLADKACASKTLGVLTLSELLGCESVAVGGEGTFDIRCFEPRLAEQAYFKICELDVYCPRETGLINA